MLTWVEGFHNGQLKAMKRELSTTQSFIHNINSRYRKYGIPSWRAILPKTAYARNDYSCEMFEKLILASINIIYRHPQNS